jgi:hypothetical protein
MLWICREISHLDNRQDGATYLNETPYCDTASKPDFQTKVTSQEVVACSRHERKAEIALPPTAHTVRRSILRCVKSEAHRTECANVEEEPSREGGSDPVEKA